MADGQHNEKFEAPSNNNAANNDASARLLADSFQPAKTDNVNQAAAEKVGHASDNVAAKAGDKDAATQLDVTKESAAVQDRFKDGPQAGLNQSNENINKLFASVTTKEGQDMLKDTMKQWTEHFSKSNPSFAEHVKH